MDYKGDRMTTCKHGVKFVNGFNVCVRCRYPEGSYKEYVEKPRVDVFDYVVNRKPNIKGVKNET